MIRSLLAMATLTLGTLAVACGSDRPANDPSTAGSATPEPSTSTNDGTSETNGSSVTGPGSGSSDSVPTGQGEMKTPETDPGSGR